MPQADSKPASGPEPDSTAEPIPDPSPEPETEWESEGGAVLPPGLPLTLRGPEGTGPEELEDALHALRRALPNGYRLERD
jgi:hypothetical protein